MDDLFAQLNTQQIEAVTATEGYVRIIAGAGSGKTKTLTHRYAYLVKAAGIHPGNILCVTFTAKAAGEMKRRVRALVGEGVDNSLITTYHGFCVRVLREDIHRLFYPQSFAILDEMDQKKILEEIYGEMEIKLDRATFEKILGLIHELKSNEAYVPAMLSMDFGGVPIPGDNVEAEIIRRYIARQKKVFGLDFDDLIAFTFTLFARFPETRDKWAERLYYIEVDEFQDSSNRELRLLKILSSAHQNLFVVGDPDQNIYEWRGADVRILMKFEDNFPGAETIFLNRNYRSSGNILRVANTLIEKNQNRIRKTLYTTDSSGEAVVHCHARSERDESAFLTDEMMKLHRTGFVSRFVEQALMQANIPYTLYGSVRFYDRMEIRDALAYLSLVSADDDLALERIVNVPKRQFGKAKMQYLRQTALLENTSLWQALLRHRDAFSRANLDTFIETIEDLRTRKDTLTPSAILDEVLSKTGYEQYIRENGSMERLDNLAELKRTIVAREREWGESYPLDLYLQQVAVEAEERDEEPDAVRLMTIHAAKGLEFPVCFVCGMSEGIFPSARTLEERKEAGLEEERRLCFVALTRAMRRLYITESEGQGSGGAVKRPSRFLFEMGEENYTRVGVIPKELYPGEGKMACGAETCGRKIGDVVQHAVFGRGMIVETDEKRRVYYISFEKGNARRPVSMDYDFDAWTELAAMREKALMQAKEAEKPHTAPMTTADAPRTDVPSEAAPSMNVPAVISSGNVPIEITKTPSEEWDNTSFPPPETISGEPETADNGLEMASDNMIETEDGAADMEIPGALTGGEEPVPESGMSEEVQLSGSGSESAVHDTAPEISVRYRNAEWNRPVAEEGETNLWKRDDVPHDGWYCVDVIDLGAPVGICRMCGYQIIRYVHVMRHPQYGRTIGAGCVCAGKMEGNPTAARERENTFKKRLARRETFLALPHKKSRNGNEYVKYHGEIITLYPDKFKKSHWKAIFRGQYTPPCTTMAEALSEAFDVLDPPVKYGSAQPENS